MSKIMSVVVFIALSVWSISSHANYQYHDVVVGASWNSCEHSRESARHWAIVTLKTDASDECRSLGSGWSFDQIKQLGYEQARACSNGKSWKYEIGGSAISCKKRAR